MFIVSPVMLLQQEQQYHNSTAPRTTAVFSWCCSDHVHVIPAHFRIQPHLTIEIDWNSYLVFIRVGIIHINSTKHIFVYTNLLFKFMLVLVQGLRVFEPHPNRQLVIIPVSCLPGTLYVHVTS